VAQAAAAASERYRPLESTLFRDTEQFIPNLARLSQVQLVAASRSAGQLARANSIVRAPPHVEAARHAAATATTGGARGDTVARSETSLSPSYARKGAKEVDD